MSGICEICGKEFEAFPSQLKLGKKTCSKECSYRLRGLKKSTDLTGYKVGMITVVDRAPVRRGSKQTKVQWNVICECGKTAVVDAADITRKDGKHRVSCGCQKYVSFIKFGQENHNWQSPNELSKTYWSKVIYSANKRDLRVEITLEQAYDKFIQQNGLCALTGLEIILNKTASLDRIDSSMGYVEGNIQWVLNKINIMKSNLKEEDFIHLCRMVARYNE